LDRRLQQPAAGPKIGKRFLGWAKQARSFLKCALRGRRDRHATRCLIGTPPLRNAQSDSREIMNRQLCSLTTPAAGHTFYVARITVPPFSGHLRFPMLWTYLKVPHRGLSRAFARREATYPSRTLPNAQALEKSGAVGVSPARSASRSGFSAGRIGSATPDCSLDQARRTSYEENANRPRELGNIAPEIARVRDDVLIQLLTLLGKLPVRRGEHGGGT
jgi:hypothetical protein